MESLVLADIDVVFGHGRLGLLIGRVGVHEHWTCVILVEERISLGHAEILSLSYLLPVLAEEHEHEDGEEQPSAQ